VFLRGQFLSVPPRATFQDTDCNSTNKIPPDHHRRSVFRGEKLAVKKSVARTTPASPITAPRQDSSTSAETSCVATKSTEPSTSQIGPETVASKDLPRPGTDEVRQSRAHQPGSTLLSVFAPVRDTLLSATPAPTTPRHELIPTSVSRRCIRGSTGQCCPP
jgi:hypothetical protein